LFAEVSRRAGNKHLELIAVNKQRLAAALELIGVLAERFPACFALNPSYRRPLKLGIHVDILAQLSDTIGPRELSAALRIYVSNSKYLKALVTGTERVDPNGMPAGTVTAEHADIAKTQYEQRREKQKSKQKQLAIASARSAEPPKPVAAAPHRISLADLKTAAQARRMALL
jgi:ProP effector